MKILEFLNDFLKNGNICRNDKVLLHSDISHLYKKLKKEKFIFEINDIADFFINYIGEKGTLIIPTFNFNFCNGGSYSIKNTISQMGAFSEKFRLKSGINRTWHPVYSFVLFGQIPNEYLVKKNYSAFDKHSLFHWITENDGKIAIIDLPDQRSMTYYHYVEECMGVDWRYTKTFKGKYDDFNSISKEIKAKIFVRKIEDGIVTSVNKMEKILWSQNLYKSKNNYSFKNCRSIYAKDVKKEVIKIISSNSAKGILFDIKK